MHFQGSDNSIHLDATRKLDKDNFMDFPIKVTKEESQQPSIKSGEIEPNDNDILLGRGGKNNMHVGNEKLRKLAREVADKYHISSKKEKSNLSRGLVQKVFEMDPPGRFLCRHPKHNHWEDISSNEVKCREKCAQVLRDAVAFVGLKDPPSPRAVPPEHREQHQMQLQLQLQQSPYAMNRNVMSIQQQHHHQQQQPYNYPSSIQMNPFARSAASSRSIMNQHMMATGNVPSASRQFTSPNFHPIGVGGGDGGVDRRTSLGHPGQELMYESPMYNQMSLGMRTPRGIPGHYEEEDERGPKRRRFSNFFERYANVYPSEPTVYGYDRRGSVGSVNGFPVGSDYFRQQMPGPSMQSTEPRRDSLLSVGSIMQSEFGMRDSEVFPEINSQPAPQGGGNEQASLKPDGEDFTSDFC